MRLPFKSPPDTAAGPEAVQAARTRARRRLIGALVLLVAGVVGFPLLFETAPRPVAPDTPIVMSPRGAAPQPRSPARPAAPTEGVVEPAPPAASAAAGAGARPPAGGTPQPGVTETAPKPAAEAPAAAPPRPVPTPAPASAPVAVARTAPAPAAPPTTAPSPAPSPTPSPAAEAARARALLEGKAVAPAATPAPAAAPTEGGRFVVQVGAYTDPGTLREARDRVEKLGLKTYTQVVEVDGSKRTRVRVGPFASRDEALVAADKLKRAGLPANVLAL